MQGSNQLPIVKKIIAEFSLGSRLEHVCVICYDEKLYKIAIKNLDNNWKILSETNEDITDIDREKYLDFYHEFRDPKKPDRLDGIFLLKILRK